MPLPDQDQIDKMHRYFAVECNNRAWELTEQATRTPEESRELREVAHATAYHWSKVGGEINNMRARTLLAEVAAHEQDGARALQLATECSQYFENGCPESTEWDRAFSTLELAYASAINGRTEEVASLLEKAAARGEQLAEKGDRKFFKDSHQRISSLIEAL